MVDTTKLGLDQEISGKQSIILKIACMCDELCLSEYLMLLLLYESDETYPFIGNFLLRDVLFYSLSKEEYLGHLGQLFCTLRAGKWYDYRF